MLVVTCVLWVWERVGDVKHSPAQTTSVLGVEWGFLHGCFQGPAQHQYWPLPERQGGARERSLCLTVGESWFRGPVARDGSPFARRHHGAQFHPRSGGMDVVFMGTCNSVG